ncbi:MAG TPA: serine/threonine-protein kinase [Polyangiaceae bacterium]|nr:serine/threonine-protein kinase [Polyangiaceae bacterium]
MATESLPERAVGRRRPELEPRLGMRLGRYELLVPLASGGMAQVWVARLAGEHGFARLVAVKTMRPEHAESDAFRRMFLDEARLAARIAHANVVEVLDLGEEGEGIVYLAMTLVEGDSVAGLLRARRRIGARGLPHGIAARVVGDVLSGLHAAHELRDEEGRPLQLVHRDVSPHNVLVGLDGIAKIADFGVAKARSRLADETEAGQVKGKFAYMAPEQLERRAVDRRSDVFSTGVVLWEALTGEKLFAGIDLIDTIARLRDTTIPDVRDVAPDVPAPIAEVTAKALERDPARRFGSAAEMGDALERAARECGAVASAKEVGALVEGLCGEEIQRRREAARDAVRAVTRGGPGPTEGIAASVAAGTETATTTVVDATRGRRTRGIAVAAAVGAIAIGAVIGLRRSAPPSPATSPPAASAVTLPAPAASPSATAMSSETPASSDAPVASAAPAPGSATPTPAFRPSRPRRSPTSAPSGPKVPYGNPYAR